MNKIAAIWARVSTGGQAEPSLPAQIARVKAKLEAEGYTVPPEYIFSVDWTSLDLQPCLEFQRLQALVVGGKISAIGMLDRDRLECKPSQRVRFLTDCKENKVKPIVCQGPPFLEGDEGDLIEFVLAMGKHRSVERASQGSKDGLHDRAVIRGLPTSYHRICGYQWEGGTLTPDKDWETVKVIWDMALKGKTYDAIIRELKHRGILSPNGKEEWNKATIHAILHNPVYAGRYYALKKEAVEPANRKDKTYGKTSCRKLPFEQWHYLPNVKVVNPPITWEQWLTMQERLKRNQELAQRNSKADYLLRGFIFCETHRGKKGEPRRYHGQPHHDSWRYVCPVGGCAHPYLFGPMIEAEAKKHTRWLIEMPPDLFYERICNQQNRGESEQSLRRELCSLEAKYNRNINAETDLEKRDLLGEEHPEVYRRIKSSLQAERVWMEERKDAIHEELTQLDRQAEAAMSLHDIQAKIRGKLGELTKAQWRELFTTLNLAVHIRDEDDLATWEGYCFDSNVNPFNDYEKWMQDTIEGERWIDIRFGLPLTRVPTQRVSEIVLNAPEPG